MRALEWALESQKTIGGKIVSIALAITLIFSFSNLIYGGNAFAEENENETNETAIETAAIEPETNEAASIEEIVTAENIAVVEQSQEAESNTIATQAEKETSESVKNENATEQDAANGEEAQMQTSAETGVVEFKGNSDPRTLKDVLADDNVSTIVFTEDYESKDGITRKTDVTLDLNGHTVKIDRLTANSCEVVINDSTQDSAQSGSLIENSTGALLMASNGGSLVINKGKIVGGTGNCIQVRDSSKVVFNGGEIYGGQCGIYAYSPNSPAALTINGGSITANKYGVQIIGGVATVNNGTIKVNGERGIQVQGKGTLNVSGGQIESEKYGILADQSTVIVEGGSIKTSEKGGHGIHLQKASQLTVTDGSIQAHNEGALGIYVYKSSARIAGGAIIGDLQGIYGTDATLIEVNGGEIVNAGDPANPRENAAIYTKGKSTIKVNEGTIVSHGAPFNGVTTGYGIGVFNTTELTINGGSISAPTFGVVGNGEDMGSTSINIFGGDINGGNTGIYHPQRYGKMSIAGGTITGELTGIEVRAGEVTISGGTITGNSEEFSGDPNGDGATVKGAGVAVSQHITKDKEDTGLTITGGDITGYHAVYENVFREPGDNPADISKIALKISDGKFTGTSGDVILSEHKNVFITGGYFNQDLDSSDTMKKYLGNYEVNGTDVQYPSHKTDFYEGYFHVHQPVMTAEDEYATNDTQHWQGCIVDNCIEAERVNHTTDDGDIIKQPVCLEDGEQELICSTCGKKHAATKTLAATGHAFGEWTTVTEATENSEGLQQRVCAHDATHVETRTIPALPVTPNPGTTDPTPVPGDGGTTNPGTGATTTPVTPAGIGPTVPAAAPATVPAATPAAPAAEETVIPEEENPLAAPEETIVENENPLAAFDTPQCWMHYLMIIGIVLTVIYGAVVVARRLGYARKIDKIDKDMTGIEGTSENAMHTHGAAHHA